MIEAGIIGRAVHTITVPEFAASQGGVLHFRYLREVGGGLVQVSETLEENVRRLGDVMAGRDTEGEEAARRFTELFVRPQGVQVPATPVFVDAIEELVERGAGRASTRVRCRWWLLRRAPLALIRVPYFCAQVRLKARRASSAQAARPAHGRAGRGSRVRVLFSAETPLSLTSFQSVLRELGRARARGRRRDPRGARDRLARPAARGGGRRRTSSSKPAVAAEPRPLARARRRPPLVARPLPVPRAAVQRDLPRPRLEAGAEAGRRRWPARRSARSARRDGRSRSPAVRSWPSGPCRRTREIERYLRERRAGRRPVHAVPRACADPARLPARRAGARAAHGDLREELGQPEQQVADPPDPRPALRLERDPARGGEEPARHPARAGRRHRRAVLRRVVRLAAAPAGGVLRRVPGSIRAGRSSSTRAASPWTGQSEVGFVRRWVDGAAVARRRRSPTSGVLVRPHPKRPDEWVDVGPLRSARRGRSSRARRARADRRRVEGRLLRLDPPQRPPSSA